MQYTVSLYRGKRTTAAKEEVGFSAIAQYLSIAFMYHHPGAGNFLDFGHAGNVIKMRLCRQQDGNVVEVEPQRLNVSADHGHRLCHSCIDQDISLLRGD